MENTTVRIDPDTFFRELAQASRELRRQLAELHKLCSQSRMEIVPPLVFEDTLRRLRDHVSTYFALEEVYAHFHDSHRHEFNGRHEFNKHPFNGRDFDGYDESANAGSREAPASRVDVLTLQDRALFREISEIISEAQRLLDVH